MKLSETAIGLLSYSRHRERPVQLAMGLAAVMLSAALRIFLRYNVNFLERVRGVRCKGSPKRSQTRLIEKRVLP